MLAVFSHNKKFGIYSKITCKVYHKRFDLKLFPAISFNHTSNENRAMLPLCVVSLLDSHCVRHLGLMLLQSIRTIYQCKHVHVPSSSSRSCTGSCDKYSNKQASKKRQMKAETGLWLENKARRERRKRYRILSWTNTADLFMWSQREASKAVENMLHLSSNFYFVFSERKALWKYQVCTLVRYVCYYTYPGL